MTTDVDLTVDQVGQFVHEIVNFHASIYAKATIFCTDAESTGIEPATLLRCRRSLSRRFVHHARYSPEEDKRIELSPLLR